MKKRQPSRPTVIVLMILSAAAGFFMVRFALDTAKSVPVSTIVALTVLFIPAFFMVIAFHEAGHAVAGVLVKFNFKMYVVGPFMWEKEVDGWQFKWNKNVNVSGGMVICLPTDTDQLRRRFSIYAGGGPLASLLLAGLAFGVWMVMRNLNPLDNMGLQTIASFIGMITFLSALIFVVTAVPLQANGFSSDGARVWRLLRGGESAQFEMLLLKIMSAATGGVRPRLQNMKEIEEALALAKKLDSPMGVYLHSFLHQVAFDLGDLDKAEVHLKDYIQEADSIPDGIRNSVWLDATFFYAFARKDLETAMLYWKKFKASAILTKSQVLAAESAIHVLRNEKELGQSKIELALSELPNMIDQGAGIALRERLFHLKDMIPATEVLTVG